MRSTRASLFWIPSLTPFLRQGAKQPPTAYFCLGICFIINSGASAATGPLRFVRRSQPYHRVTE